MRYVDITGTPGLVELALESNNVQYTNALVINFFLALSCTLRNILSLAVTACYTSLPSGVQYLHRVSFLLAVSHSRSYPKHAFIDSSSDLHNFVVVHSLQQSGEEPEQLQ